MIMTNATYNRLSKDDAIVLLIDHQTGLISLVQDFSPNEFKNNVLALADLPRFFKLPTVLTTQFRTRPQWPAGSGAQGHVSRRALHCTARPDQRLG
ncbi:Isochorismatase hydrolase [Pseudomonas coronafaciens pv. atropurpurea]|nr:Isochorismatase hydrolase [Pseudomonas coronafaciens pv. atropurpurea]